MTSLFSLHSNTLFTIYDVEDTQLLYSLKIVVLCIKCQVSMPCIGHYFVTLTIVLKFGGFFDYLYDLTDILNINYFKYRNCGYYSSYCELEDCKFLVVLRLWQFDMSKYL